MTCQTYRIVESFGRPQVVTPSPDLFRFSEQDQSLNFQQRSTSRLHCISIYDIATKLSIIHFETRLIDQMTPEVVDRIVQLTGSFLPSVRYGLGSEPVESRDELEELTELPNPIPKRYSEISLGTLMRRE